MSGTDAVSQVKTYTTAEIRYGTQGGSFVALADHESTVGALRAQLAEPDALLREARELVRPLAVLSPGSDFARLKSRLDKALLHSPAPIPGERIPGCADAAWLLYDANLYGQHGVLVMGGATILQKATSYAGYHPPHSQEAGDELAAT